MTPRTLLARAARPLVLALTATLAGCLPFGDDTAEQSWSLAIEGGAAIGPGLPPEIVSVTIPTGVTSSIFRQAGGQWYVLDRLDNVVEIQFTETFVSNRWRFTGTGGPSPDGLTVQISADGDADAGYPAFTVAQGTVTFNFMQPGLPPVTQTAGWTGVRN